MMGLVQPLEEVGSGGEGTEEEEIEGKVFFFLLKQAPIRDIEKTQQWKFSKEVGRERE